MTRGDWGWLVFGGLSAACGVVMMLGGAAGWWHL